MVQWFYLYFIFLVVLDSCLGSEFGGYRLLSVCDEVSMMDIRRLSRRNSLGWINL